MFRKLLLLSIVAVFFLIFIGSFVRTTGAGMGCPDWPKCFGKVVPPSDVSELPSNYLELYKEIRIQKNLRLEKLFIFFGIQELLYDKQKNHSTYVEVEYDFKKAWIEYVNRVIGVLVGFLVLGVFLSSLQFWISNKTIIFLSFIALICLIAEAFLGSIVVSTNLFPELISIHMLLAIVLVMILMYLHFSLYVEKTSLSFPKGLVMLAFLVLVCSSVQMFFGIQVREKVDFFHNEMNLYDNLIEILGADFIFHRSFSVVVLILNLWLFFLIGRYGLNNYWSRIIIPIIGLEIFTGMTLANFNLMSFSQPFHLLLGSLLIGMQFLNFLYLKFAPSNS